MSYRQSFSKRIAVHYSGSKTVSVAEGQRSVTVNYSGTEYEDVQVNIDVETTPFDRSITQCNNTVNVLTGAVVATETAQIVTIDKNAKKIGSTIVDGFFKTIRSEISQQISELSSRMDATLMHLHEMAKRCVAKQKQMESDYSNISGRYLKIFADLNKELTNRVFEIDKPAFVFKKQADAQHSRSSENDLVSVATIFAAEDGSLQARIGVSVAKKRALDTILKANKFLVKQKYLNATINNSMLEESLAALKYSPVCYLETQNEHSQIDKSMFQSNYLPKMQTGTLIDGLQGREWKNPSVENSTQIGRYFYAEVSRHYSDGNVHSTRVRENIINMFDMNRIRVL